MALIIYYNSSTGILNFHRGSLSMDDYLKPCSLVHGPWPRGIFGRDIGRVLAYYLGGEDLSWVLWYMVLDLTACTKVLFFLLLLIEWEIWQETCYSAMLLTSLLPLFKSSPKDIFIVLERKREVGREGGRWGGEREREITVYERNFSWLPPICAPPWDQACSLGMCPDWELNLQPFGILDNIPTNQATQPGPSHYIFK